MLLVLWGHGDAGDPETAGRHCPIELSAVVTTVFLCAVQRGSRWPLVAFQQPQRGQ